MRLSMAKVKTLCFNSPKSGVLEPLERSLHIINWQEWDRIPF
jgi:hypothetical protein